MDDVKRKVLFNRPGGNTTGDTMMARITLPPECVRELGITPENREVIITLEKDKIIIKRA